MKKLIIAACAVAFAIVTQAANLNWGAYGALNDGGADEDWYSGGQAYLILVTDVSNFAIDSSLNIAGGRVIQSADIDGGFATNGIDGGDVIDGGLVNGSSYNFAVLFTTDGVAGTTMPTTGLYGLNDNDGELYTITWNSDTGAMFANEETYAAVTETIGGEPIPEPTSGLMLLLGVAGLALRRKQK